VSKILFIPFSVAGGLLAGLAGRRCSRASGRCSTKRIHPTPRTGVGLTLDEIAVLTELNNPYWESDKLALTQAALAALAAGTCAIRFHRGQSVS
jgi:hypothetical protein